MKRLLYALACAVFIASPSFAHAQTWPDKPIRVIVSIAAGSVTDVIIRAAAKDLEAKFRRHSRRTGLRAIRAGRLHALRHLSFDHVV